jgi:hypothetical protein
MTDKNNQQSTIKTQCSKGEIISGAPFPPSDLALSAESVSPPERTARYGQAIAVAQVVKRRAVDGKEMP